LRPRSINQKRCPGPYRPVGQKGVAALGLAATMVVFVGTMAGVAFLGHDRNGALPDPEQAESLRWAEEAISGFVATQGRLPCPSSTRGGTENCAASFGKGWLPTASLEQFARPAGTRGRLHARYAVYRGLGGTDPDLAVATDAYQPTASGPALSSPSAAVPATDSAPTGGYPSVVSNVDLCAKLRATMPTLASATSPWRQGMAPAAGLTRADRAHVVAAGGIANVAYALAVAPTGASEASSLSNADAGPGMEDPSKAVTATYRDVVRAVDFRTLHQALSCALATASLDTLAMARTWTDDSAGMRKGTIEGSMQLVKIEAVIVSSEVVEVASSVIDTGNAVYSAMQGGALVVQATPGLPETLPAFNAGTQGLATSLLAKKFALIDTGRNTVGLATESTYAATYLKLAKDAEASRVWTTSVPVVAAADELGTAP
jgi:hypothetical protein